MHELGCLNHGCTSIGTNDGYTLPVVFVRSSCDYPPARVLTQGLSSAAISGGSLVKVTGQAEAEYR